MNLLQLVPNHRALLDAGSASCYISDAIGPARVSASRSARNTARGAMDPGHYGVRFRLHLHRWAAIP
jgi:hypothetical protein